MIGDLQYNGSFTLNSTPLTYQWHFWDYLQVSATLTNGQVSATYTFNNNPGDCINWVVAGLYFREASASCTPFTATLSSSGTLTCAQTSVKLTAGDGDAGATYVFSSGAQTGGPTSATTSVNNSGPYSVTVTNPSGCSAAASTTVMSSTMAPGAPMITTQVGHSYPADVSSLTIS